MVRTYVRKTNRQNWNSEDMSQAVEAILNKRMGFQRASNNYKVPKSTLERHVRLAKENPDKTKFGIKILGTYKPVFNEAQENELVSYINSMQGRLFEMSGFELRSLAFELAKRNNIDHRFNVEEGMAGKDWLRGFLNRHPDLSYSRPEPTSAARAMGFNKMAVNSFFYILEKVVDDYKLTSDRVYNVGETGVSTVPKIHSNVIALKGFTTGKRGQTITAEICFSATGSYVPPMLIYPSKRIEKELVNGCPPGFGAECSDSGWINVELFLKWFKAFVNFSNPSKEAPVLLLLDGHSSHTKNMELIDYARNHNVILLCFPPHCTHKMQPLDVAFLTPISTFYSSEVKKWLRNHPGRVITQFQIAEIFGQAYLQSATMTTAISGFKKCGIWPVNRDAFTEDDFLAESTNTEELEPDHSTQKYNIAMPRNPTKICSISSFEPQPSTSFEKVDKISETTQDTNPTQVISELFRPNKPQKQRSQEPSPDNLILEEHDESRSNAFLVSQHNVLPIPNQIRTTARTAYKLGKTAIMTDSPYKNTLIEENYNNKNKNKDKAKKAKLFESEKKQKTKSSKRKKEVRESSSSEDDDNYQCISCGYLYSQSSEGWVPCIKCAGWSHNSCADVDEKDEEVYICTHCKGGASCSKDETSHFQEKNIPNLKVEVMDGWEEDNNPLTEETFSSSTFDVSEQVTGSNQEDSYTSQEKDLEEQIFTSSQYTSLGNEQVLDPSVHSVNGKKETEFDLFGKSIGVQLNNMVLNDALQLQLKIQQLITEFRLKNPHATLSTSRSSHVIEGASSIEDLEVKTEYVTDSFVSD